MSTVTETLGASEVAAALGLSPWTSPWELWARKTGRLTEPKESEALDAGVRLEPVVIKWAEQYLGPIQRGVEAAIQGTPIVTHPDGLTRDGQPVEAKTSGVVGQIVGHWGEPGSDEIPEYYLVQCLVQLEATKADVCHVPALLGGRGFVMYRVPSNRDVQQAIVERAVNWFEYHVIGDRPPELTAPPPLNVLKKLRRDPGRTVEIDQELVERWQEAKERAKEAQRQADELQAAVIAALGDAEAGELPDGRLVTYYEQFRKGYTVEDTTFRVLRVKKGARK